VLTERSEFLARWQGPAERSGLELRSASPEALSEQLAPRMGVVFDAGSSSYDEDELLNSVGYARAMHALPVVAFPEDPSQLAAVADLLSELCDGMVTRSDEQVARVCASLARRCSSNQAVRFEYLSVSPRGGELLAILGDCTTRLLPRPVVPEDDGSEIGSIVLSEDAQSATVQLANGKQFSLRAEALASAHVINGVNGHAPPSPDIDGKRLGARLRALRLSKGMTQAELARRTGIHRPNIARVEAGRHTPSLETLARLASAIGVPTTRVLADV